MIDGITPTPYQSTVLAVPEKWNLLLAGGRGGGKSMGALLLILRHVEKYGDKARPLIVRETHKAVQELEEQLDQLLSVAYGKGVRHNRAEHTFRLPNGAIVECGQLDGPNAYKKFQGRSFTLLVIDEFGLVRAAAGLTFSSLTFARPKAFRFGKFVPPTQVGRSMR